MRRLKLAVLAATGLVAGAASAATIPNQYIVTLKKPASGSPLVNQPVAVQARSLLADVGGGEVLHTYEYALRGFAVRLNPARAVLLAKNPMVASVRPDVEVKAVATQANPPSYGIDRVDQRDLPLSGGYTYADNAGQGAHVYVIDTGLNANHTDFTGRVGAGRNFVSVGPLGTGGTDPANWADCNGHGTHVSGTAVGTAYGVAKKATIHAVRVLGCNGLGDGAAILAGIDWVAANAQQPAVANMSLGTVGSRSPDQETAVRNLVNANVAVAVAAGNDSKDACGVSPAAEPSVLTTGATERTDGIASYSNFGACLDLFAPGTDIVSASYNNNTGNSTLSGTSMASPHVAGALAVKRAANTGLSAASAQAAVVADTTPNRVTSPGAGSPNKLLYVPVVGGGTAPVDAAPVASFTASCTNLACAFSGAGSTDDKGIASYAWAFGDGTSGTGATVNRTYAAGGTYNVTLRVTDTVGQTNAKSQPVLVTAASTGGTSPCNDCTTKTGTLAAGATAYDPGSEGFSSNGGAFKGYLRGPGGSDFDLYLEKYNTSTVNVSVGTNPVVLGGWGIVARGETTGTNEDVTYTGGAGTYRWRIKSNAGAGTYTFYVKNP